MTPRVMSVTEVFFNVEFHFHTLLCCIYSTTSAYKRIIKLAKLCFFSVS